MAINVADNNKKYRDAARKLPIFLPYFNQN